MQRVSEAIWRRSGISFETFGGNFAMRERYLLEMTRREASEEPMFRGRWVTVLGHRVLPFFPTIVEPSEIPH